MLFDPGPEVATADAGALLRSQKAWLALGIGLKLVLFAYVIILANRFNPSPTFKLYLSSGDEAGYLTPAENVLNHEQYVLTVDDPATGAYRMPGYALTYLPLRIAFGSEGGKVALILLQVVLGGAAVYWAARVAAALTGKRAVFITTFFLAGLSITSSVFDSYTLTDGLMASVLVLAVSTLLRFGHEPRAKFVVVAGALMAYVFFLRPYALLLFIPMLIYVFEVSPRPRDHFVALFLSVLVVTESLWIVRNFALLGRFEPFRTAGLALAPAEMAVERWTQSFGGDIIAWRPGTAAAWLMEEPGFATSVPPIPAAAFTPECDLPRVIHGAELFRRYLGEQDPELRSTLGPEVSQIFSNCREAYRSRRPFDYHVTARLRLLKAFFVHGGPVLPIPRFFELPFPSGATLFKASESLLYVVIAAASLPGLLMIVASRVRGAWLVASVPLYFLAVLPLGLRRIETRYLADFWPFQCMAAGIFLVGFVSKALALYKRSRLGAPRGGPDA